MSYCGAVRQKRKRETGREAGRETGREGEREGERGEREREGRSVYYQETKRRRCNSRNGFNLK